MVRFVAGLLFITAQEVIRITAHLFVRVDVSAAVGDHLADVLGKLRKILVRQRILREQSLQVLIFFSFIHLFHAFPPAKCNLKKAAGILSMDKICMFHTEIRKSRRRFSNRTRPKESRPD